MVVTYLSHHNQKMFVPRLSRIIHLSYLLDVWAIFEAIFKFLSRSYNQKTEVDKKNLVRGEQISGKNWLCQEVFFLVSVCNDHRMIVVTRPPARRQVPVKSYKCLILFAFRSVWSRSLSLLFLFHCFSSITVHPPSPASPIVVCYCCVILLCDIVVWYCCVILLTDDVYDDDFVDRFVSTGQTSNIRNSLFNWSLLWWVLQYSSHLPLQFSIPLQFILYSFIIHSPFLYSPYIHTSSSFTFSIPLQFSVLLQFFTPLWLCPQHDKSGQL